MGAEHSRFEGNGLTPKQEIRQYIQTIRSRPTNTMEQWNLMIDAERVLDKPVPLFPGSDEWAIPDHNGGWEPPLG
jgi:hypothetical protein